MEIKIIRICFAIAFIVLFIFQVTGFYTPGWHWVYAPLAFWYTLTLLM